MNDVLMRLRAIFLLTMVVPSMLLLPQIAYARGDISCSSYRGGTNTCRADTRDGVRLSRQLSRAPCRENDTWGYDRRGIWVANGCAAEFSLGRSGSDDNTAGILIGVLAAGLIGAAILNQNDNSNNNSANQSSDQYVQRDDNPTDYGNNFGYTPQNAPQGGNVVRCESGLGGGVVRCPARISRSVEVAQMLPGSFECKFKEAWGYDQQGIWVTRGCRADFLVN